MSKVTQSAKPLAAATAAAAPHPAGRAREQEGGREVGGHVDRQQTAGRGQHEHRRRPAGRGRRRYWRHTGRR